MAVTKLSFSLYMYFIQKKWKIKNNNNKKKSKHFVTKSVLRTHLLWCFLFFCFFIKVLSPVRLHHYFSYFECIPSNIYPRQL